LWHDSGFLSFNGLYMGIHLVWCQSASNEHGSFGAFKLLSVFDRRGGSLSLHSDAQKDLAVAFLAGSWLDGFAGLFSLLS
jgi:hypothetical protein